MFIDEIGRFAAFPQVQAQLRLLLESFARADRPVVINSACAFEDLGNMDERLLARLSSGLRVRIEPADVDLRLAIAAAFAHQLGFVLPPDVANYIAMATDNPRIIVHAVKKVRAYADFYGTSITLARATKQLQALFAGL